jgi:DNA-binding NtrC family response regulator
MRDDRPGPALILTSDDVIRENLARALHGLGHEALVASSVSDAAEILERTPVRFSMLQASPGRDHLPALLARLPTSPRMRNVWEMIQPAARADVTVLIGGETGTGKDLAALSARQLSSASPATGIRATCGSWRTSSSG